jgi:hypothetical protein
MRFRHSAGFGKPIEYWIIGRMLKEGLDVYVPLVDDSASRTKEVSAIHFRSCSKLERDAERDPLVESIERRSAPSLARSHSGGGCPYRSAVTAGASAIAARIAVWR